MTTGRDSVEQHLILATLQEIKDKLSHLEEQMQQGTVSDATQELRIANLEARLEARAKFVNTIITGVIIAIVSAILPLYIVREEYSRDQQKTETHKKTSLVSQTSKRV